MRNLSRMKKLWEEDVVSDEEREAAKLAAHRRLRPVLLTTVSTISGLLPLSLGFAGGTEFWAPLGWSIIFGLAAATVLTLVVIPTLYTVIAPESGAGAAARDRTGAADSGKEGR